MYVNPGFKHLNPSTGVDRGNGMSQQQADISSGMYDTQQLLGTTLLVCIFQSYHIFLLQAILIVFNTAVVY